MRSVVRLARRGMASLRDSAPAFDCVIGLTGSIASGKSHAREFLETCGAAVIDADKLGHSAYKKGTACWDRVVAEFGADVVGEDGEVDRKRLGAKVFASADRMTALNHIVWPAIEALARQELHALGEARSGAPHPRVAVIEAAILIEAGWDARVDEVWVTHVPDAVVVERLRVRNGLTEEDARRRLGLQMPSAARVARATVAVDTSGSKEETRAVLLSQWEALLGRLRGRAAPAP